MTENANLTPSPSDSEVAASLAQMVTEWVEGGLRMKTDWRSGLAEVIQARLRRLSRPAPAVNAVRIKPLQWVEAVNIDRNPAWLADTVVGRYELGFEDGWYACLDAEWEWEPEDDPRSYDGPTAAMAAAQADYEARIRSALDEVSHG